jgi:hypothetical protein
MTSARVKHIIVILEHKPDEEHIQIPFIVPSTYTIGWLVKFAVKTIKILLPRKYDNADPTLCYLCADNKHYLERVRLDGIPQGVDTFELMGLFRRREQSQLEDSSEDLHHLCKTVDSALTEIRRHISSSSRGQPVVAAGAANDIERRLEERLRRLEDDMMKKIDDRFDAQEERYISLQDAVNQLCEEVRQLPSKMQQEHHGHQQPGAPSPPSQSQSQTQKQPQVASKALQRSSPTKFKRHKTKRRKPLREGNIPQPRSDQAARPTTSVVTPPPIPRATQKKCTIQGLAS